MAPSGKRDRVSLNPLTTTSTGGHLCYVKVVVSKVHHRWRQVVREIGSP